MRNNVIIDKMIDIIEKLQSYVGENDYNSFSGNDMLVDACVFNLLCSRGMHPKRGNM